MKYKEQKKHGVSELHVIIVILKNKKNVKKQMQLLKKSYFKQML
jgi:hypothetical protein